MDLGPRVPPDPLEVPMMGPSLVVLGVLRNLFLEENLDLAGMVGMVLRRTNNRR